MLVPKNMTSVYVLVSVNGTYMFICIHPNDDGCKYTSLNDTNTPLPHRASIQKNEYDSSIPLYKIYEKLSANPLLAPLGSIKAIFSSFFVKKSAISFASEALDSFKRRDFAIESESLRCIA